MILWLIFDLIIEGESGLGKSTLINSLFMTDLYKDRKPLGVEGKQTNFYEESTECIK